ncbi:hypothetical protein N9Y89_00085 [bacterium]|nr:hypothetical protein [bacterium]
MKQAEILMVSKGEAFDTKNMPLVKLHNEYFGGSMGSIVFQTLLQVNHHVLLYSTLFGLNLDGKKVSASQMLTHFMFPPKTHANKMISLKYIGTIYALGIGYLLFGESYGLMSLIGIAMVIARL